MNTEYSKSMEMGCDVLIEWSSQHHTNDAPSEVKYQPVCLLSTTNSVNLINIYIYTVLVLSND